MTAIYLAQVERHKFIGGKICLLAEKRSDRLWVPVAATPDRLLSLPHQYHTLAEGVLVLVELSPSPKREITKLTPALPEILKLLSDWSMRVLNHNTDRARIEEWKDSLALQTAELGQLKQKIQQDRQVFELEKSRYVSAIESMRSRIQALEAENEALKAT